MSDEAKTTADLRVDIAGCNLAIATVAEPAYEQGWCDCAEDVALPIAAERDALRGEVERLQAAVLAMPSVNEWTIGRDRYLACPFCGDVSADGIAVPHGTGCPWWELVPGSGGS